jgi:adenosine deaminase
VDAFLARMPKVELHVHLEGAMRPRTLLALARKHGVALPADDLEGLRHWFQFRDFEHFVEIYLTCSRCLRDPEDFERLALDFLENQARENVVYSEVHFTISTHLANGADGEGVRQALAAAREGGRRRFGADFVLIPDIVRNMPVDRADATLDWAVAGRGRGVVALGLSGIEAGFPNEPFRPHFAAAVAAGLHPVAHAGEHAGPESIRSALDVTGAERIGHGVRAVEDSSLVAELVRRRIPLEVCPTSNVCLKVFQSLEEHSFDALYRAGVPVSVNSDDPPFFSTTLTREYQELRRAFGYGAAELAGLSLAGLEASFLPPEEKARYREEFRRSFAALGEELLDEPVEPVAGPAAASAARRGG